MLIRELTKQPTTTEHHKHMTARHASNQGEVAKPGGERAAAAGAEGAEAEAEGQAGAEEQT